MSSARTLLVLPVILIALLGVASIAHAQVPDGGLMQIDADRAAQGFVPLANVKDSRLADIYQKGNDTSMTFSNFISGLFTTVISLGAILAVLRLGYAGYLYMTSDSWGSKGKAKEVLGDAALGLFLLLSCYLILYQINPDILKLNILESLGQAKIHNATTTPGSVTSPTPQTGYF